MLLFTSVVTPPKLERLAALNARATGLHRRRRRRRHVATARRGGAALAVRSEVLVDVEVGGGRTGRRTPEDAVALARPSARATASSYAGVQGYDGTRRTPSTSRSARREVPSCRGSSTYVDALHAADLAPGIISGGGTGSHDIDQRSGS